MNQHERNLEQLQQIKRRWQESEWRLNFLRSFTGQPMTAPTDDELLTWDSTTRQTCLVWQIPPTASWI